MSIFLLNYIEISKEKDSQKVMAFRRIKFKGLTFKLLSIKNYEKEKDCL